MNLKVSVSRKKGIYISGDQEGSLATYDYLVTAQKKLFCPYRTNLYIRTPIIQ